MNRVMVKVRVVEVKGASPDSLRGVLEDLFWSRLESGPAGPLSAERTFQRRVRENDSW